jgi:hypothetical protein
MTRIRKWWKPVSRFFWPGLGALWALYGVYRLIHNNGYLLPGLDIVAGITLAVVPFTTVKCPNCGDPIPFKRFWDSMEYRHQFTCRRCHAHYGLPAWKVYLQNALLAGFVVTFAVLYFHRVETDMQWVYDFLDAVIFYNAFVILLARFLDYKKLDGDQAQPASKALR